jgi:hypothetical protein
MSDEDVRDRDWEYELDVFGHRYTVNFSQYEIVEKNDGQAYTISVTPAEGADYTVDATFRFPEGGVWSDLRLEVATSRDVHCSPWLHEDDFKLDLDKSDHVQILRQMNAFVETQIVDEFIDFFRQPWSDDD